ncbi:hypothetical protein BOTBODRAFT_447853 [Botryobasidium botryosum FD-172 SS1]|uniref:Uncharacterized protein n=1 Tax=Botryobasidium botryosum (strain FD-172 SS1) TaxID=930990 RepID=A0A067MJV5_BOTB1|nr:hypothetical protein BOTBODRAFT_447853 [Botryobasidium botryosum FD-172 SS1]
MKMYALLRANWKVAIGPSLHTPRISPFTSARGCPGFNYRSILPSVYLVLNWQNARWKDALPSLSDETAREQLKLIFDWRPARLIMNKIRGSNRTPVSVRMDGPPALILGDWKLRKRSRHFGDTGGRRAAHVVSTYMSSRTPLST